MKNVLYLLNINSILFFCLLIIHVINCLYGVYKKKTAMLVKYKTFFYCTTFLYDYSQKTFNNLFGLVQFSMYGRTEQFGEIYVAVYAVLKSESNFIHCGRFFVNTID